MGVCVGVTQPPTVCFLFFTTSVGATKIERERERASEAEAPGQREAVRLLEHARAEIVEQNLNLNEIVFGDSLCMAGSPTATATQPCLHCLTRWTLLGIRAPAGCMRKLQAACVLG